MTLPVTESALAKLQQVNIEPKLVLCIDGVDYCFTSISIKELIRYGMPDLFYGDPVVYGGTRDLENQKEYISNQGTSNTIKQQLEPEKGAVSSVTSITVRLIDKNEEVTQLITPGVELVEPLGNRAELSLGFGDTAFPDDYMLIHSGIISDIKSGAGYVDLSISSPEEKKRQQIFPKVETTLNGAISDTATTLTFDGLILDQSFLEPADDLTTYVRIDDEIIGYTGVSGNTLTGLTRGNFTASGGSLASPHEDEAAIETIYVLEGHPIELALKVMLSNGPTDFDSGVEIESFNFVGASPIANAIFFSNIDIFARNGVVSGDTITVTGATNGGNNGTFIVDQVIEVETGSYVVVSGSLVDEIDSPAVCSFQSQYNVLPDGLGMLPEEVDIAQHNELLNGFLASAANIRIYMTDTENGKELIEKEFYLPTTGYSLPRKGKASVGAHLPPIPGEGIITLDETNIRNASKLVIRRSFGKNFYNQIIYKFDQLILEDKYVGGVLALDQDSINEIKKRQSLVIQSRGLRSDLQAGSSASTATNRLLERYRRGAEYLDNVEVLFRVGSRIEAGDIVAVDFTNLKVSNTRDGNRNKPSRLFEVINRTIDLKTGRVRLNLIDTNFDGTDRFALFSPASFIKDGLSTSQFIIEESFGGALYGINEFQKWSDIIGAGVKIRSEDYTVEEDTFLVETLGNTLRVDPPLSFTPSAGMLIELSHYDNQTDRVKVLYSFMTDDSNPFPSDNGDIYVFA